MYLYKPNESRPSGNRVQTHFYQACRPLHVQGQTKDKAFLVSFSRHTSLSDFSLPNKPCLSYKEAPKQTLCSLPTSDRLYIVSNSIPKTSLGQTLLYTHSFD